jgi:hypothetical protein
MGAASGRAKAAALVIGRKFASAFDGWNGIGTKSHCQTEKCLGLCFFTKNLNEPLKVVSLRTAIYATIHQDAEFGRRLVALVAQLIETVKRQFNDDFHLPKLLVLSHKCNWYLMICESPPLPQKNPALMMT